MIIKYGIPTGIIISIIFLIYVHYDRWITEHIGPWVQTTFEQSGACCMQAEAISCTLIAPSITFHHVNVTSNNQQPWHWTADRYTISFSWFYLILYGIVDLHITIDGLHAYSCIESGVPSIMKHIMNLTTGPSYGISSFIASCIFHHAQLILEDKEKNYTISCPCTYHLQRIDATLHNTTNISNGTVSYHKKTYAIINQATITSVFPATNAFSSIIHELDADICLPDISPPTNSIHAHGTWNNQQGMLELCSTDKQLSLQGTNICRNKQEWCGHIAGTVPTADIARTVSLPSGNGTIAFDTDIRTDGTSHHLDKVNITFKPSVPAVVDQLSYAGSLAVAEDTIQGTGICTLNGTLPIDTRLLFNSISQSGTVVLTNNQAYAIPATPWTLKPHAANITIALNNNAVQVQTECAITTKEKLYQCTGTCNVHDGIFDAQFNHPLGHTTLSGSYRPTLSITRATTYDHDNKPLVRAYSHQQYINKLHAIIGFDGIKQACTTLFGYEIQGEGTCIGDMHITATGITGRLQIRDGSIRLPGVYNFIRSLDLIGSYDKSSASCTVTQGMCKLDRGIIRADGARLCWNPDGSVYFAYLPISLHRCMLTIDHGIFALLSGNIAATMQGTQSIMLNGHILIDQAHLEGNIFSHLFQRTIATSTRDILIRDYADICECSLTCDSVEPMRIKTAFVDTYADLTMRITGKASQPFVNGHINFNGGAFLFPYKPLYITHGSIHFDEQQLQNSLIELTASNKIKKYDITMFISGSLQHNTVNLVAIPTLSEEQILSLLLIGAHEESLNMVMPALIMQNLSNLIFNQKQSSSQLNSFFGRLLQPFDYIHFVPVFADQSGRGGLRGMLEIEISDRLRATIQKNFSLLEDTRFEVEYAVSDDIVVRGMRNERRDVGGEVEIRWKF